MIVSLGGICPQWNHPIGDANFIKEVVLINNISFVWGLDDDEYEEKEEATRVQAKTRPWFDLSPIKQWKGRIPQIKSAQNALLSAWLFYPRDN